MVLLERESTMCFEIDNCQKIIKRMKIKGKKNLFEILTIKITQVTNDNHAKKQAK
jgi:hypothetical protein